MIINGEKVKGISVAYEGCHKIYICEDEHDEVMMRGYGYSIYPLDDLPKIWDSSCSLRFISNAKLDKQYVGQFEEARFEWIS